MAPSQTLSAVPDNFPEGYTYKIYDDLILVKEITNENSVMKWLEEYKLKSKTTWTCCRTYKANGTKVEFKKQWKCHFNVQARQPQKETLKRSSKNLGCGALITVTVFKTLAPKKKNKKRAIGGLRKDADFPCQLEVLLEHNHLIDTAAAKFYNRPSPETKARLLELFLGNHTAASARQDLLLDLYLSEEDDYSNRAVDRALVPSLSTIQHLFSGSFAKKHGAKALGGDSFEDLRNLVERYARETPDGRAACGEVDGHRFAAICTPTMTRAHSVLPQSKEVIFVDKTSHVDKKRGHVAYEFVSAGPPGGVTVGLLVTDVEAQNVFRAGLEALVRIMPANSFFGKKCPSVVVTDEDLKERWLIRETWSSRLLLCQAHLLKAHWRWLSDKYHKIQQHEREEIYFAFKRVVHAATTAELEEEFYNHVDAYRIKYPMYSDRLLKMYDRRTEWADAYRRDSSSSIGANSRRNHLETIFRIVKDCLLEKVKTYNVTQLVHFFVTKYEAFAVKRLMDFSRDRYCRALAQRYLPSEVEGVDVAGILPLKAPNLCFLVPSASSAEMYQVDVTNGFCACVVARSGRNCKHLCACIHHFCVTDQMYRVDAETRAAAFEIATGKNAHDESKEEVDAKATIDMKVTEESLALYVDRFEDDDEDNEIVVGSFSPNQTSIEEFELHELFERIRRGMRANPEAFVPAAARMIENAKTNAGTDAELLMAMCDFARPASSEQKVVINRPKLSDHNQDVLVDLKPFLVELKPNSNKRVKLDLS